MEEAGRKLSDENKCAPGDDRGCASGESRQAQLDVHVAKQGQRKEKWRGKWCARLLDVGARHWVGASSAEERRAHLEDEQKARLGSEGLDSGKREKVAGEEGAERDRPRL
eukprot:6173725-Pleurochrysis_carterae.AAC.5